MMWQNIYEKLKNIFDNTNDVIGPILVGADHILLALSILTVLILFYAVIFETRRYKKRT